MTTMESAGLITTEELLAMPDDGVERELSRGRLREREMTRRGRRHTKAGTKLAKLLDSWLDLQPQPRGEVLTGEAAFQLRHDPDTTVGIDVAYISSETAAANPEDAYIINGVPILAVEILSPSDKQEDVLDKIQDYLDAGVPLVWSVEPVFKTITVYRPGTEPQMFSLKHELTAEPQLPGFRVPVAAIFGLQ
jgi:Uma2 family endonuclease